MFCEAKLSVTAPSPIPEDHLDKYRHFSHLIAYRSIFMPASNTGFRKEWMCVFQTVIEIRWIMWTDSNRGVRLYSSDLKKFMLARSSFLGYAFWKFRCSRCCCWRLYFRRSKRSIAFSFIESSKKNFFQAFEICFPKITRRSQENVCFLRFSLLFLETTVLFHIDKYLWAFEIILKTVGFRCFIM